MSSLPPSTRPGRRPGRRWVPNTRPGRTRIRDGKTRSEAEPRSDGLVRGGPAHPHPPPVTSLPSSSSSCPSSTFPFTSPSPPSPLPLLLPPSSSSSFPSSSISNFVEDSFSSDDFQKLQIVTSINTKDDALGVLEYKCFADNPSALLPPARQNPSFNSDAPVPTRARSKCSQTAACNWSSGLVVLSPTTSSSGSSDAIADAAKLKLQPRCSCSPLRLHLLRLSFFPHLIHLSFFPLPPSVCAGPGPGRDPRYRAEPGPGLGLGFGPDGLTRAGCYRAGPMPTLPPTSETRPLRFSYIYIYILSWK